MEIIPVRPTDIEVTKQLQKQCLSSYLALINNLKEDMAEEDIAEILRKDLAQHGVTDYWYNVPIFVTAGVGRFLSANGDADYATKQPSSKKLNKGDPLYIDIHPRDTISGRWGDFSATVIFKPLFSGQVEFLDQLRQLQEIVMTQIDHTTTPADLANKFLDQFNKYNITHVDKLHNFGHTLGAGAKDSFSRTFIDTHTNSPRLAGQIWGIEPGGYKDTLHGRVVGKFETAIWISNQGEMVDLTDQPKLPLTI